MREKVVVASLLLAILAMPCTVTAQNNEVTVLEIINGLLSSNERYQTTIYFERYAPHAIESDMNYENASVTDPIITINIDSDVNSMHILFRGDTPYINTSFIPFTSNYELEVKNNGYVDEVIFNLTIRQTGPAITTYFSSGDSISGIILLLAAVITIPPTLMAAVLVLYKKTR